MNTSVMTVTKRNGHRESVDLNKIVRAVERAARHLPGVDIMRVATRTVSGLYDGATTRELDELSIRTAATLSGEDPQFGFLAASLLSEYIDKEVRNQDIMSFSQSVIRGFELGLINERLYTFVQANSRKLNDSIVCSRTLDFEHFGLRTVYDRYLLKHPKSRHVIETPQYFFMRVACALSGDDVATAQDLYELFSLRDYLPSSPTLFNAGTKREQLSSCYLLDSPEDDLGSIYDRYKDIALLSKFAGGIGVSYSRIRSSGSLIEGTNGPSSGIVPWIKTLDSSVAAVDQGGRRKGAACVYLETWHADIEAFLELRDNTGDHARRTHNLNLANWIPDLFMERVEADGEWSLFDPKDVPELVDLWGDAFRVRYEEAEAAGLARKTIRARSLWERMLRTLAETGNGWMNFKDRSNATSNQTAEDGNVIHLSNLCTEILEVTDNRESQGYQKIDAVCNLGSINLSHHVIDGRVDYEKIGTTVRAAIAQLDRVIDINYYPIPSTQTSNKMWRPVGLGVMGLQDVFFKLQLPFDSPQALEVSNRISEEIYYHALSASCDLAEKFGAHPNFAKTRAARGELQFDYWKGATINDSARWAALRDRIKEKGLRNSLMIAIAPTATIASIAGCYECIEPQVSNLFKRETLSGDFIVINRYLVHELKSRGLWTATTRDALKLGEGSVAGVIGLPDDLKKLYRTAWELPQRALIDLAVGRGAFVDQSQSLNLFMESPAIGKLSSMYMYAWKQGIKTSYYLRSRPATKISKTTVGVVREQGLTLREQYAPEQAIACSLENPESCEACQ